jgi:hypothetical protein
VPVLHRNTINFIGMEKRTNYMATRVIDDKFITLDRKNHLRTWGVLNGKIRMEWNLSANKTGQDYSNFEIYKYSDLDPVYNREWYSKILIKSKTSLYQYDENTFFDPEQTKSHMKSQVSYIKKNDKSFHEFKLIEIVNEREVKEHLSFIHPCYEYNKMQSMLFSNDLEYMFERLVNGRFFLYKKVALNNP